MPEIIKFNDKENLPIKLKGKSNKQKACNHRKILLNSATRLIECCVCGVVLDPFEYLLSWAMGDIHLGNMRRRLRIEIQQLSETLDLLMVEKRKTKASITRLKKKLL